jgi:hypothetical protein
MTETKYTTPHVHKALVAIRKGLSVEKDGTLPSNMGSGKYVSAGNLAAALKSEFDEHGLLFHPVRESIVRHEVTQDKTQRTLVAFSIEAQYRITSTVDGSEITIGGAGDGLATGTSVANNIASTNALKNALLRLVMATEGGVENASKDGIGETAGVAPEQVSGLAAVRKRLQDKSKTVEGPVKGSEFLDLVLASSEGDLKSKTLKDIWGDEQALTALESLVDKA